MCTKRVCHKCKEEKGLNSNNFYANKASINGFEYCCKKCSNTINEIQKEKLIYIFPKKLNKKTKKKAKEELRDAIMINYISINNKLPAKNIKNNIYIEELINTQRNLVILCKQIKNQKQLINK